MRQKWGCLVVVKARLASVRPIVHPRTKFKGRGHKCVRLAWSMTVRVTYTKL